jgi:predicted hydrocarbon binding protein
MGMFDIRKIQEQVIFKAVKEKSDAETAKEIIYGCDGETKKENNTEWVKSTMHRLENKFDQEEVRQIRMSCQCGYEMDEKLALLKELMSAASNIEEFGNSDKAKAAGLFYKDGVLYLQFFFCPCPMLADVDKLETKTWCQCTTGYSKVLFEKAFGCQVDVELLKSIKAGDDICLMKIIPRVEVSFS